MDKTYLEYEEIGEFKKVVKEMKENVFNIFTELEFMTVNKENIDKELQNIIQNATYLRLKTKVR